MSTTVPAIEPSYAWDRHLPTDLWHHIITFLPIGEVFAALPHASSAMYHLVCAQHTTPAAATRTTTIQRLGNRNNTTLRDSDETNRDRAATTAAAASGSQRKYNTKPSTHTATAATETTRATTTLHMRSVLNLPSRITSTQLTMITQRMATHTLHTVNFANCAYITDADIMLFALNNKHSLAHINLTNCTQLTNATMTALKHCQNLRVLILRNCHQMISNDGFQALHQGRVLQRLRHFDISYTPPAEGRATLKYIEQLFRQRPRPSHGSPKDDGTAATAARLHASHTSAANLLEQLELSSFPDQRGPLHCLVERYRALAPHTLRCIVIRNARFPYEMNNGNNDMQEEQERKATEPEPYGPVSLTFERCTLDDPAAMLSRVLVNNLVPVTILTLSKCKFVLSELFMFTTMTAAAGTGHLRELHVHQSRSFTNEALLAVCLTSTSLSVCSITNCDFVTREGVERAKAICQMKGVHMTISFGSIGRGQAMND